MVEMEKRKKKKGRPSKADLEARRAAVEESRASPSTAEEEEDDDDDEDEEQQREVRRRSLRRKSFRYNIIDYDEDYLDENIVSDEVDVDDVVLSKRERGRKVKLVVKLNNYNNSSGGGLVSRLGRVGVDSDEEDDVEEREGKKRRVDEDEEVDNEDDDFVAGTPNGNTSSNSNDNCSDTPLPDKKQLEVILEKLQKKDTYGVFSEPVDPEELPDYHDIIDHPMDFSTIRNKLSNGDYSTLEQFETDVFLISSNAMQYNSHDTVYYKQARAIKELAEKNFERARMQIERLEKESKSESKLEPKFEPNSEQKERSYPLIKKQKKKMFSRGMQEPVGSDFSSGATLATPDAPNICSADHIGNFVKPINNDGSIEGSSSLADNILEKAEDPVWGKVALPKFARRTFVVDENRRATYNISVQPEENPDSIFMTFNGDKKQLIPVGLSGELSYARSLARYAANLGPMAWRISSKRIEQVLPPGFKYGHGWVGEYEPLPTPFLDFKHIKDPFASRLRDNIDSKKEDRKDPVVPRSHDDVDSKKDENHSEGRAQANVHLFNHPSSNGKMTAFFGFGGTKPPTSNLSVSQQKDPPFRGSDDRIFKGAESNSPSIIPQQNNVIFQQQNQLPRDIVCRENMSEKRVESTSPSISYQTRDCFPPKQLSHGMEEDKNRVETNSIARSDQRNENTLEKQPQHMQMPVSMPSESLPKGKNFLQSLPFKRPDANGGSSDGLYNGKVLNNFVGCNLVNSSSQGLMSPQLTGAPVSFPLRQDQGLSDPVLVMKMMTEKAQRQQNGSMHTHIPSQVRPSVPMSRGDNTGGNAAQAAAGAWMSVGSGGFRPPAQNSPSNRSQISTDSMHNATTQMFYPQAMQPHVEYPGLSNTMNFHSEKMGLPFQSFSSPQTKVGNEAQGPGRSMVFPQLVSNDLSRFQVQDPWRGLSPHTQQKQKSDTLPPDLNVAFQSSVDSQQPDLALQL